MRMPLMRQENLADIAMLPSPIDPSWVTEGDPRARVASLSRHTDGTAWTDLWDCTAGSFEWRYDVDETIHVVDGAAELTDDSGRTWSLRAGDVVSFRAGSRVRWVIPEYVRKIAFCQHRVPRPLVPLMTVDRRLRERPRWRQAAATMAGMLTAATAVALVVD